MARSARLSVVVLAALLLALAFSAATAQAAKKISVGPGDSIQAAIDAAKPGTTIIVSGLHRESVAVTKDGIELRGEGAVLEPPATPTQNACFGTRRIPPTSTASASSTTSTSTPWSFAKVCRWSFKRLCVAVA